MINKFVIYGERCSGTSFLHKLMRDNFELEQSGEYGWKHWFGFNDLSNSDHVVFIGIVRHPVQWIASFFLHPHHVAPENRIDFNAFLFNEWFSLFDTGEEIVYDRHIATNDRYKNVFELRKVKNDFLMNEMPKQVKNYTLIHYEQLRDNPAKILGKLRKKFNLKMKSESFIITENDETYGGFYIKRGDYILPKNIHNLIAKNICRKQERMLGYTIKTIK